MRRRDDPALNYCLWEYSPVAAAEDKFRSINLLFQSFDYAGVDARAFEIVEAIRDGIGAFRTVFGIKSLARSAILGILFLRLRPARA